MDVSGPLQVVVDWEGICDLTKKMPMYSNREKLRTRYSQQLLIIIEWIHLLRHYCARYGFWRSSLTTTSWFLFLKVSMDNVLLMTSSKQLNTMGPIIYNEFSICLILSGGCMLLLLFGVKLVWYQIDTGWLNFIII